MDFTSDEQVKSILRGIIDLKLPKPSWTHAAHFAAAVAIIDDPRYDAVRDMPGIIRAYNQETGVENTDSEGYHHTITVASLMAAKAVYDANDNNTGYPLHETVSQILTSEYGNSGWLLGYWSREALFSVKARRDWVAPNLKPLPDAVSRARQSLNVTLG